MPNKAKQESIAKSNINTADCNLRKLYPLNFLKKQQQQHKVSIEKRQLRECIDRNELLKAQISCQEANIIDLQRKLDEQYERNNQLEAILLENVSSLTNDINAIKAECGAYLEDMRTQVEISDMRRAKLERELLEVKENYLQIEKDYEMAKRDLVAEKENLLKNYANRPKPTATADINQRGGNDGIIQTVSISPFASSVSSSSDPNVDAIQANLTDQPFGNPSVVNSSAKRESSQSGSNYFWKIINSSAQLNVEQNIPSKIYRAILMNLSKSAFSANGTNPYNLKKN